MPAVMPLFLMDSLLFSARGIFLIALIIGFNGVIAGLIIAELKCCWEQIDPALVAASWLTVGLLFWLLHWENLISPEQIHMYVWAAFVLPAGRYAARLDLQFRQAGASALLPIPMTAWHRLGSTVLRDRWIVAVPAGPRIRRAAVHRDRNLPDAANHPA